MIWMSWPCNSWANYARQRKLVTALGLLAVSLAMMTCSWTTKLLRMIRDTFAGTIRECAVVCKFIVPNYAALWQCPAGHREGQECAELASLSRPQVWFRNIPQHDAWLFFRWKFLACMVWFEGILSKQTTRCSMVFKCSATFAKPNADAASRMPLITYLRADAMRERHIEAIVKEVKARCIKKAWTWDDHCKNLDRWPAKDEANGFGSTTLFMKHNETIWNMYVWVCSNVVYSFIHVQKLFSVYVYIYILCMSLR